MIEHAPKPLPAVRGWSINRIVALYILIGSLWILTSDRLIIFSAPDPAAATLFSTVKGLTYVAVTAALLHWLISRHTAELRKSELQYRLISENAADVIWRMNLASDRFTYMSPSVQKLRGYSPEEVLAQPASAALMPVDAERLGAVTAARLADFLAQGSKPASYLDEVDQPHKDGSIVHTEVTTTYVLNARGESEIIGVTRDITARKRAETALQAQEEKLRTVFNTMEEGLALNELLFDDNGQAVDYRILEVNPAYEKIISLTREQAVGKTATEIYFMQPAQITEFWETHRHDDHAIKTDTYIPELKRWRHISTSKISGNRFTTVFLDNTEQKTAEEALRQSEAFKEALISYSPLGISVRSRTGQLLFANAAWRKIWAISEATLRDDMTRQRDALQFNVRDNYLTPYQADLRRIYEQGGYLHLPDLKTTDPLPGGAEWIAQHFYAITDDHGQVDRVVILTEDVSDRRRAEQALRESEERYRLLAETSPDPIFLHQAGSFVFVNPAACKLLGATSPDELIGRPIAEVVHPDSPPIPAERVQTAQEQGQPVPAREAVYMRLDGSPVNVEVAASSLLIGGQPTMQVIARDITDRKQRERELEAIAAIATALRAAATRHDMFPVIVQQVHSLLKTDGAALITREPDTDEAVIACGLGIEADSIGLRIPPGAGIVGHVIATGRPYLTQDARHDPHIFRPDLASALNALACAPLIAHDQIIGVLWMGKRTPIAAEEARLLAAIADIAANALYRAEVLETLEQRVYDRTRELAEANERLKELDRLKSKFVSDVSHELRTPITSLMLNVELLEHGKPEKRDQYLHVIRQQTTRQVQLIEDILNLSRLELSTARTQFTTVDINALIQQAVDVYRSSAEAANLELNFTPSSGQPMVQGVDSHLSQVVTNLIANAINYTPAGSVDVSARLTSGEVIIEVRDTGLGIAPEDVPHLFDRFYRGKLTWRVRGSGLGLAIVKEITEVHKGRIEVDSQAGVGSTFRVYLPLV